MFALVKQYAVEWIIYFKEAQSGKKTIAVGVLMIVYGVSGGILGHVDPDTAVNTTLSGLGLIALRLGIEKIQPPQA